MRFKQIEDSDYQKLFVSPVFKECDWPLWFFIRLEYTDEWGDSPKYKYHCSILAVSPDAVGPEELKRARECCGVDEDTWNKLDSIARCEILLSYGTYAILWQDGGNNQENLIRAAKKEMIPIGMMTGFYLDRPMNAIGNSGWDFLQGNIGFKTVGVE